MPFKKLDIEINTEINLAFIKSQFSIINFPTLIIKPKGVNNINIFLPISHNALPNAFIFSQIFTKKSFIFAPNAFILSQSAANLAFIKSQFLYNKTPIVIAAPIANIYGFIVKLIAFFNAPIPLTTSCITNIPVKALAKGINTSFHLTIKSITFPPTFIISPKTLDIFSAHLVNVPSS